MARNELTIKVKYEDQGDLNEELFARNVAEGLVAAVPSSIERDLNPSVKVNTASYPVEA